jgi:ADP-heptose:LPS heptosyltransferase
VTSGAAGPRLVTLRALGLGDLLTAVPALRGLRRAFPGHHHVLLAPASWAPLVDAIGAVDELVPVDGRRPALAGAAVPSGTTAVERPEVAVNLHGRGPDSHRLLLALGPGRLLGFRHPAVPGSGGGPAWCAQEHEVRRWCRMLGSHGVAADPGDLALPVPPPPRRPLAGATVVHPGASSAARRWPPERFASVARAERDAGRAVVVTGGDAEAELVGEVVDRAGLGDEAVLVGAGLGALMAVVAHAGRAVCGDTGVAHLATAFATPSVVLFGPVPPSLWGPPDDRPWHRALWAGHLGDPHGEQVDAGLLALEVADVLAALDRLPAPAAERRAG